MTTRPIGSFPVSCRVSIDLAIAERVASLFFTQSPEPNAFLLFLLPCLPFFEFLRLGSFVPFIISLIMFSIAAKHLSRRTSSAAGGAVAWIPTVWQPRGGAAAMRSLSSSMPSDSATLGQYDDYGSHVFAGKIADEYLSKHGASGELLNDPTWVKTRADTVANAIFDW
jgi:hypothetical protein